MASSSSSAPAQSIKQIKFSLGKGNRTDGKLVVVRKADIEDAGVDKVGTLRIKDKKSAPAFFHDVLLTEEFLGIKPPKVLISVTGAAADFNMDPKLEQIFGKGLVNAAKSTTAWIVSGGTDVGVMRLVGEANRKFVTDVPTIGFATYNKINNKELLKPVGNVIEYDGTAVVAKGSVNLNSNHTHFVLVEGQDKFGEEIEARSDFEEYVCSTFQVPGCLIVVNGGPGTLRTVAEGCNRQFSVVIFEGTGRAADAVAREVRRKRGLPYDHLETMNLDAVGLAYMNDIVKNDEYVTLYSPDKGEFDLEVLKSIIGSAHGSLLKKLCLATEWNRADLAEHVLEAASKDKIPPDVFGGILSKALEYALDREQSDLFRLFADKGAKKADIDLSVLYTIEDAGGYILDPLITRYAPHLPTHKNFRSSGKKPHLTIKASEKGPLLGSDGVESQPVVVNESRVTLDDARFIKAIFVAIDLGKYADTVKAKLKPVVDPIRDKSKSPSEVSLDPMGKNPALDEDAAEIGRVKFTDTMLWAILVGRLDLAKVIWEYTSLPVHAALLGAGACRSVAQYLANEREAFFETADWFEATAVKLLDNMDYDGAKMLFQFGWPEFGYDTLQLAVDKECKDFMAHSNVQRYLDGLLYSDVNGGIPPGTSSFSVILNIFLPFLLYTSKTYEKHANSTGKWYHFYALPYTKFWTTTLCYLGYLILLAFTLVGSDDPDNQFQRQVLLWVWMLGIAIEEVSQWREEGMSYFRYTANRMDIFILVLQIAYFGTSLASHIDGGLNRPLAFASEDILIITTIISYVRFMDVFSISQELGPLYIVLLKIMNDVFKWIFVFILFAIGFQVSFMALADQVGENKWQSAIQGGSFGGAFYVIIGDWDTTMGALVPESNNDNTSVMIASGSGSGSDSSEEVLAQGFSAFLVSVYALIAQIMLVNLLIAMMGDTFNSVKENSDKEWRFSRYNLITEYTSTSFHPPPFNIVLLPMKNLIFFFQDLISPPVPASLDIQDKQIQSTKKARDQFKNLMRDTKDEFLEETAKNNLQTIGAVADAVRDSFKQIIDESEIKHKTIELKLNELAAKTSQITVNAGGAPAAEKTNADLKMEMNYVQENVNNMVKSEIGALQKTLLEAIKAQHGEVQTLHFTIQGREIPVTWSAGISSEVVQRIPREFRPFQIWMENMNKPEQAGHIKVNNIVIQSVDMFGQRIGFVKYLANTVNETGQRVPGIVFMRGGAVGMLVVLKLNEEGSPDHNKEYTILTIQPRVPIGHSRFAEIPAGMVDGGRFVGAAAKELKEETGIEIDEEQLIDLTSLAYQGTHVGMYPSAGGCDEVIRLYLYRTTVTREQLNGYQNKLTGLIEDGEVISLKVIPLDELWTAAPDAKALSALFLYYKLMETGTIARDY